MEKFQEIYDNPDNSHFEKVIFHSDTPAIGVVGAANKEIFALMSTKELLSILKTSVPSESLTGLSWGKSISYSDASYKIDVTLTQEKTVKIELIKLKQEIAEPVQEKYVKKEEVAPVDPEILDNLMQGDALIYFSNPASQSQELSEILVKSGYETRLSSDINACIQAMNYKEFPVIGLVIETDLASDKVLKHLKDTSMLNRRSQFSFLIASGFESGNPDQAYSHSVSLVLDSVGVSGFEAVFNKNLPAWKRVIEPFREALKVKA